MSGIISFNGKRSDDLGILIEKYPSRTKPVRKMNTYSIPGRNGDIVMMQDAWENVEQKYDLILGDGAIHSASEIFHALTSWLCGPTGYCELWDDFDPGHYRLAYVRDAGSIDPIALAQAGRVTITFVCDPRRFLISGKRVVSFTSSPGSFYNETAYKSKPLIKITRSASGVGALTIGTTVFTITSLPETLWIDCEDMICYNSNGANQNSVVSSNTSEFAVLNPGSNTIAFDGNISNVEITPRTFEI